MNPTPTPSEDAELPVSTNHYPRVATDLAMSLCHAIESAGCSTELTRCSVLASELHAKVRMMEETLNAIHDHDNGAWTAGKHRKEAVALGYQSIQRLATDRLIAVKSLAGRQSARGQGRAG